jgi:hypothetical protein
MQDISSLCQPRPPCYDRKEIRVRGKTELGTSSERYPLYSVVYRKSFRPDLPTRPVPCTKGNVKSWTLMARYIQKI